MTSGTLGIGAIAHHSSAGLVSCMRFPSGTHLLEDFPPSTWPNLLHHSHQRPLNHLESSGQNLAPEPWNLLQRITVMR